MLSKFGKSIIVGWGLLGYNRGINSYNYKNNKNNTNNTNNNNNKNNKNNEYLYSDKIFYGIFGAIMYVNPLLIFISISKEIYRLEINLRGLEDAKKTDYYNELI